MTDPIDISPPKPPLLTELDAIGATDPAIARSLTALFTYMKSTAAYNEAMQIGSNIAPIGPRTVTVTQLGGTLQISFTNEASNARVVGYQIWRATAGTRSSPTTPTFDQAARTGLLQAQNLTLACFSPNNANIWIDRDFTITQLDPANPARFSYWVTSIDDSFRESPGVAASTNPIEVLTNGPGDQAGGDNTKVSSLNMLFNTQFDSKATVANVNVKGNVYPPITAATNVAPIQITAATHGFNTGDRVAVYICQGNTAANGLWTITKVDANNFTLNGSTGNGAYVNPSGYCTGISPNLFDGQPEPNAGFRNDGSPLFHQWVSTPESGGLYPQFKVAAGLDNLQLGEILFPILANSANNAATIVAQFTPTFRANIHACFSIYLKTPTLSGSQSSYALVMAYSYYVPLGGIASVISPDFNLSTATTTYQRYVWNVQVPTTDPGKFSYVTYYIFYRGSSYDPFLQFQVRQPMMASGDQAGAWTSQLAGFAVSPISNYANLDQSTAAWSRTVADVVQRDSSTPYV